MSQTDCRGKDRRRSADDCNDGHRSRRFDDHRAAPRSQINARSDHRRRVDQRRHRSRTGHRVRQPDEKRNLRGFARRPDKQQQCDSSHNSEYAESLDRPRGRLFKESRNAVFGYKTDRTEGDEDHEHCDHVSEIAHAVRNEGLFGCIAGLLAVDVITDQQIRTEPYTFPSDEKHQQIVGQHQRQHHEHKQVEIGEEPVKTRIAVHIACRVYMNQQSDAGDEEDVDAGERVEHVGEVCAEVPHRQPGEEMLGNDTLFRRQRQQLREEDDERQRGRDSDRSARDQSYQPFIQSLADQPVDDRTDQRREDNPFKHKCLGLSVTASVNLPHPH